MIESESTHGTTGLSPTDEHCLELTVRIFRAVADVSRLRILELLQTESRTVSQLAQLTGNAISTTSHQLRILWTERLVRRRRNGKNVLYSLADPGVTDRLLSVLKHMMETRTTKPDEIPDGNIDDEPNDP